MWGILCKRINKSLSGGEKKKKEIKRVTTMWGQEDPQVKQCNILIHGLLIVFCEWIWFLEAFLGFTYRQGEQKLQSSPMLSYPSSPASNDSVFIHCYSLQSTAYITVTALCVYSVQFSSFAHSRPTLCNPMDCSTPGLPVYHQVAELAQTHVHRLGDAI